MEVENYISSIGISNHTKNNILYFHIFAISKDNKKVFFCGDCWDEDINNRAESTDFIFVYDEFANIFNNKEARDTLLASLLF